MDNKPTHAKPQLYTYYFLQLKEIAKEYGYNLVVHGSLNRDLDLIAIPWVDDPKPEFDMINAMAEHLTGRITSEQHKNEVYLHKQLPGGRVSYVINLNRGGYAKNERGEITDPLQYTEDPQYYIDISVTPLANNSGRSYYQLCPKCNGQGTVCKPPYVPGDVNEWSSSQAHWTCHVCEGAKILLVNAVN